MVNIAKKAALKYLKDSLTRYNISEIMNKVYDTVIVGNETTDFNAMTFYCRAYNITAYGVENQYKGILSDFFLEYAPEDLRSAFSKIFTRYPRGITTESPTFADALEAQLIVDAKEKAKEEGDGVLGIFGLFR